MTAEPSSSIQRGAGMPAVELGPAGSEASDPEEGHQCTVVAENDRHTKGHPSRAREFAVEQRLLPRPRDTNGEPLTEFA